jgi:hypothetical protein
MPGKHRLRSSTVGKMQNGRHWADGELADTQKKRKPGKDLPHDAVVEKARDISDKKHGG